MSYCCSPPSQLTILGECESSSRLTITAWCAHMHTFPPRAAVPTPRRILFAYVHADKLGGRAVQAVPQTQQQQDTDKRCVPTLLTLLRCAHRRTNSKHTLPCQEKTRAVHNTVALQLISFFRPPSKRLLDWEHMIPLPPHRLVQINANARRPLETRWWSHCRLRIVLLC